MEAQLKGAVLIALVVVPQWRCPILKPLSAKLPPKSETAPHSEWQNGKILGPGVQVLEKFFIKYLIGAPQCGKGPIGLRSRSTNTGSIS